jgi:hypothetical protein
VTSGYSGLSCSSDNGAHWKTPVPVSNGKPRVFVGGDGTVYVTSHQKNAQGELQITVERFKSCDQNMQEYPNPFHQIVHDVQCPVAGLDRCNNGNTLDSPTVAADDTNPSHVYLAWAQDNQNGGDDVVVADSNNGGETFGAPVALNSVQTGHRFMPWVVAYDGIAYVSWYDRRNPSTLQDLTRYYLNSASVSQGVLTPGTERDLSRRDDPQCSSGFPAGGRNKSDDVCVGHPSGICGPPPKTPCSTTQPCGDHNVCKKGFCATALKRQHCSFKANPPTCPSNQQCNVGNGNPKYGDYNNLAVGGGLLLNQWASSTAPVPLPLQPIQPNVDPAVHIYVAVTTLPKPMSRSCGQCKLESEQCIARCGNAPNCPCNCLNITNCNCMRVNHCGPCPQVDCSELKR